MAIKFAQPKEFPKATVMPKLEELVDAKPIDLKKTKRTASGSIRKENSVSEERKRSKEEVEIVVDKMIKRGDIVVREKSGTTDTTDPSLREHFGKLLYVGANQETICEILKIPRDTYRRLKRQHLESVVESLAETGVMGMVALSFDKMEMASARTLQLIAGLGDTPDERQDLVSAVRLLKDIENDKIGMLVKTGAIRVKKRADISAQLEVLSGGTQPLLTGEKAQAVMIKVMANLVEAIEGDDDDESGDGEEGD